MPKLGHFKELGAELTSGQRAFAQELRRVLEAIGWSCETASRELQAMDAKRRASCSETVPKEADLNISRTALAAWASGRRTGRIRLSPLRALHSLAAETAGPRAADALLPWDEFERLARTLAPDRLLCPTCGIEPADRTQTERILAAARPADGTVRSEHDDAAHLPVPRLLGDRQVRADAFWPDVAVIEAYFAAGDVDDAAGILGHTGAEAAPEETARAVATCAERSLPDAVDVLLRSASRRPVSEILQVARNLGRLTHHVASAALLELACNRLLDAAHDPPLASNNS